MLTYTLTRQEREAENIEAILDKATRSGILSLEEAIATYEAYFLPEISGH